MSEYTLEDFLSETRTAIARSAEPADCVEAVAPLLHRLINGPRDFLKPEHFRSAPDHYARNAIDIDEAGDSRSTPWCGCRASGPDPRPRHLGRGRRRPRGAGGAQHDTRHSDHSRDSGIGLRRGGTTLLGKGTVASDFVPNPDHIHKTGVPQDLSKTVSLHLYGRAMHSFHVYDVSAGTREQIEVFHNES